MKPIGMNRRVLLWTMVMLPTLSEMLLALPELTQTGALSSWNDGSAKRPILEFVRSTTDQSNPNYVQPQDRISVFDQDGTLWVEHPMYTQVVYCLDRVPAVVTQKPQLKNIEPFKTVLAGNQEAIAKLSTQDLEKILDATMTGMSVEEFQTEAKKWLETAKQVGTFTPALYEEAKKDGWTVISIKNDWKRIFAFD